MTFESIEIRTAKNGFIVTVHGEFDTEEHVFVNIAKAIKFVKDFASSPEDLAE